MTAIVIPRGLARAFRAVARKCSAGRPRGPAPPVVVTSAAGRLTLTTFGPSAVLLCDVVAPGVSDGTVIVPAEVLDAVATGGPVELYATGTRGVAKWGEQSGPRELEFDAILAGRQHRPPDRPDRWGRVTPVFLGALHACGQTASREPTARFALTRVQVRGKPGQVVGSDGRRALLWAGFRLPFPDDLLVPALPVFGAKEVSREDDVRVGRTATHLVVAAGPWTVFLPVDATARFPDVAGVVPRATGAATLDLGPADVDRLLAKVPGLPGADADDAPVTLALGPDPEVRARGGDESVAVPLPDSTATGPPQEVSVNRADLLRALALGLHRVCVAGPSKPVVWADDDRTYLAMPLTPDAIAPSAGEPAREPVLAPVADRRTAVMPKPPDPPGPPPAGSDPPDLLAEAETLKAALGEAATRAARLVHALKHARKKTKVLSTAWTALRALDLGPGGGR